MSGSHKNKHQIMRVVSKLHIFQLEAFIRFTSPSNNYKFKIGLFRASWAGTHRELNQERN